MQDYVAGVTLIAVHAQCSGGFKCAEPNHSGLVTLVINILCSVLYM